ncbi:glycosyltransferase [Helicobacter sp. XJK30-2]|uniref:Glycosyltransferase n=2 Tax=Helicobacter zhangjianzhongii TaxID=2974574 RepID=A0ACC6FSB2_9HELI|nr:glycosyltransferase [Helicobacter sp. XJK30-2]MDL0082094.1 glycosyltransferase [Helicobacter sp. XJK30-2]
MQDVDSTSQNVLKSPLSSPQAKSSPPIVAVVVPCYNEEAVLVHTHKALSHKLRALVDSSDISPKSFICYVDDGSKDSTWEILSQLATAHLLPESTFEKVDSRNALFANATSMDCHADKSARNDSELDSSVDCHANASAFARNDYKNAALQNKDSSTEANLNEPAQDSSNEVQNIANSAKDSKILELESWLCEPRKEDKTSGLSTQRGEAIRDSSPKAESLVDFPPPP